MLNQSPALDRVFHALADPSRRVIVERLRRGPASVKELAQPLAMSLPSVPSISSVRGERPFNRETGRVRTAVEPVAWTCGLLQARPIGASSRRCRLPVT